MVGPVGATACDDVLSEEHNSLNWMRFLLHFGLSSADETAQQISCFVLIAIEVVEAAASRVWEFREIEEVPIKRARQMRGTWQ